MLSLILAATVATVIPVYTQADVRLAPNQAKYVLVVMPVQEEATDAWVVTPTKFLPLALDVSSGILCRRDAHYVRVRNVSSRVYVIKAHTLIARAILVEPKEVPEEAIEGCVFESMCTEVEASD